MCFPHAAHIIVGSTGPVLNQSRTLKMLLAGETHAHVTYMPLSKPVEDPTSNRDQKLLPFSL